MADPIVKKKTEVETETEVTTPEVPTLKSTDLVKVKNIGKENVNFSTGPLKPKEDGEVTLAEAQSHHMILERL